MGDGDDGSLVSTPHHETTKFRLVVASLGSHGGGCRLHHDRFQKRIAFAHGDLLSLACTFVIAGTQPGPGSKPMFIRPWQHVIADFTEDRERCIAVQTGHLIKPCDQLFIGLADLDQLGLDLLTLRFELPVKLQLVLEQLRIMRGERTVE